MCTVWMNIWDNISHYEKCLFVLQFLNNESSFSVCRILSHLADFQLRCRMFPQAERYSVRTVLLLADDGR